MCQRRWDPGTGGRCLRMGVPNSSVRRYAPRYMSGTASRELRNACAIPQTLCGSLSHRIPRPAVHARHWNCRDGFDGRHRRTCFPHARQLRQSSGCGSRSRPKHSLPHTSWLYCSLDARYSGLMALIGSLQKRYLYQSARDPRFWPQQPSVVFPYLGGSYTQPLLGALSQDLNPIRKFRNRVFQHEPIWARTDLVQIRTRMFDMLGWMSPETARLLRSMDRLPLVMDAPFRRKLRIMVYRETRR